MNSDSLEPNRSYYCAKNLEEAKEIFGDNFSSVTINNTTWYFMQNDLETKDRIQLHVRMLYALNVLKKLAGGGSHETND